MGARKLRYAADGPFVENTEGGGASPAEGFQTRAVWLTATPITSLATASNGTPLTSDSPVMGDVRGNLRYRVDLVLHAQKTDAWTATATVAWTFQYSADGGANWTTWQTLTYTYGGLATHDMPENVTEVLRTTPVLASTLTGVSDGDSLQVRVLGVLSSGTVDGEFTFVGQDPAYILQLIEEL